MHQILIAILVGIFSLFNHKLYEKSPSNLIILNKSATIMLFSTYNILFVYQLFVWDVLLHSVMEILKPRGPLKKLQLC